MCRNVHIWHPSVILIIFSVTLGGPYLPGQGRPPCRPGWNIETRWWVIMRLINWFSNKQTRKTENTEIAGWGGGGISVIDQANMFYLGLATWLLCATTVMTQTQCPSVYLLFNLKLTWYLAQVSSEAIHGSCDILEAAIARYPGRIFPPAAANIQPSREEAEADLRRDPR